MTTSSWMDEPDQDSEETSEKELSDKTRERQRKQAMNTALYWLGRAPQTKAKITEKLTKKEIHPSIIEDVLAELEELKYINDDEYARMFVNSRSNFRMKGKRAIAYELHAKGIDKETAQQALENIDSETEKENARKLVDKRLPSTAGLERNKRVQRLAGFLARKGYPGDIIFSTINDALAQEKLDEQNIDEDE